MLTIMNSWGKDGGAPHIAAVTEVEMHKYSNGRYVECDVVPESEGTQRDREVVTKQRWALRIGALVLVTLAAAAGWNTRRLATKPPPIAAGLIRLRAEPGRGIPPEQVPVGKELSADVTLSREGGVDYATVGFVADDTPGRLASSRVREGDTLTVRDLSFRVVHIWYYPRVGNRAVDLLLLSGPGVQK